MADHPTDAELGQLLRALHGLRAAARGNQGNLGAAVASLSPVELPRCRVDDGQLGGLGEIEQRTFAAVLAGKTLTRDAVHALSSAGTTAVTRSVAGSGPLAVEPVHYDLSSGGMEATVVLDLYLSGDRVLAWAQVSCEERDPVMRLVAEGIGPCHERMCAVRADSWYTSSRSLRSLLGLLEKKNARLATVPELLAFFALYPEVAPCRDIMTVCAGDPPLCVSIMRRGRDRPVITVEQVNEEEGIFVNQTAIIGVLIQH